MLSPKIYSFQVPASGSFVLQVPGRYLRVNAATNPVAVTIDGLGTLGAVSAGQGLKLRDTDQPFQRLVFTDSSGANNNVTVIVADSDFVDNTVLGTVNVVDAGLARTLANIAFATNRLMTTTVAANLAAVQLWNNNVGRNLVVEQIGFQCSAQASVTLKLTNVNIGGSAVGIPSKLAGGAASASAFSYSNEGAAFGGSVLATFGVPTANSTIVYQPKTPLVLPAGYGLTLVSQPTAVVTHTSSCNFEHVEQAVQ